ALLQSLAERAPELERLLGRLDRLVAVVGDVAGPRAPFQELGTFRRRQTLAKPQDARVVRRRLAMSADSLRTFGRGRGITKHCVGVPGGLGVVCEPGDVD